MKKLLLLLFALFLSTTVFAQVTLSSFTPPYGWLVAPGAQRTIQFYISGGATNKINYSVTGPATLSCTSNCPAVVTVTMNTGTGGTASVSGSVGAYTLSSTVTATLTATSVDDPTKTTSVLFNSQETCSTASVQVEPAYDQAFKTQKKTLQSYVVGCPNQEDVTWSITSQPSGGDGALTDTGNRDTQFSASVPGRYKITATSVTQPSLSNYGWVYVTHNMLPRTVNPNRTVPTDCEVDPAMTGNIYQIGPSQTTPDPITINWQIQPAGSMACFHNEDTTGTNPTTYAENFLIRNTYTRDQPLYWGVISDSAGNPPVLNCMNSHENPAGAGTSTDGGGAIKLVLTGSVFGEGYGLGSAGPDYVGIHGLHIENCAEGVPFYTAAGVLSYYDAASAVQFDSGQHILIEGIDSDNNSFLSLANNNTGNAGRKITMFHQFIGNYIHHFGTQGNAAQHALYAQGFATLVEGNYMLSDNYDLTGQEGSIPGGDYIKMRGGDSIIRYNTMVGLLGAWFIEYPDMEDTYQYVGVDMNLGVTGDTTCSDSVWCTITSNNITLQQLTENAELLAHDDAYGNVMQSELPNFHGIQYVSQSAPTECAPCTNMADRNGHLRFWNNTMDRATQAIALINPAVSGQQPTNPIFSQTTAEVTNNSFWSDNGTYSGACGGNICWQFSLNYDETFVGSFLTNMYATWVMNLTTPVVGGTNTGFGNYVSPVSWSASPLSDHVTGLTAPNFLTTSTVPYNPGTYAPITSSPLIGAGTTTPVTHMPCRYQPDTLNGYVNPRTDNCTTIGAVQSGDNTPTPTSFVLTPVGHVFPSPPATTFWTYNATLNWSNPLIYPQVLNFDVCTWGSTNSASLLTFSQCSAIFDLYNGAVAGTGNVTASYDGFNSSTPFVVGAATVADPTFSPVAGTYSSTQSVAISTVTAGATICWTNDGSTPTASSGTCTHGTTYSGVISVSITQTLQAIASLSGDTNSNVISALYTIVAPVNGFNRAGGVFRASGVGR